MAGWLTRYYRLRLIMNWNKESQIRLARYAQAAQPPRAPAFDPSTGKPWKDITAAGYSKNYKEAGNSPTPTEPDYKTLLAGALKENAALKRQLATSRASRTAGPA